MGGVPKGWTGISLPLPHLSVALGSLLFFSITSGSVDLEIFVLVGEFPQKDTGGSMTIGATH